MDDFNELVRFLANRFRDVPGVTDEDIEAWAEAALLEHGLKRGDRIPPPLMQLILLFAEADGASQVALKTAHFFKFTDKDESVDKSMISKSYQGVANEAWRRYQQKKDEGVEGYGGPVVKYMRRIDRP